MDIMFCTFRKPPAPPRRSNKDKKNIYSAFYFSSIFFKSRDLGGLYVQGLTLFGLRQGGAGEFRRHQIFMSRGCSQGLVAFPFPLQFPLRNLKTLMENVVLFCIFILGGCAFFPAKSALCAIQFGSSGKAPLVTVL